jgi:UPF0176 protein
VVSVEDQQSPFYKPGEACPACHPDAKVGAAA